MRVIKLSEIDLNDKSMLQLLPCCIISSKIGGEGEIVLSAIFLCSHAPMFFGSLYIECNKTRPPDGTVSSSSKSPWPHTSTEKWEWKKHLSFFSKALCICFPCIIFLRSPLRATLVHLLSSAPPPRFSFRAKQKGCFLATSRRRHLFLALICTDEQLFPRQKKVNYPESESGGHKKARRIEIENDLVRFGSEINPVLLWKKLLRLELLYLNNFPRAVPLSSFLWDSESTRSRFTIPFGKPKKDDEEGTFPTFGFFRRPFVEFGNILAFNVDTCLVTAIVNSYEAELFPFFLLSNESCWSMLSPELIECKSGAAERALSSFGISKLWARVSNKKLREFGECWEHEKGAKERGEGRCSKS